MMDKSFNEALEDNIKNIAGSGVFVNLWEDDMENFREDPWPAIQLAIAIMLNKPIVLCVIPGRTPPEKMIKIADKVIEGGVEEIGLGIKKFMDELP